MKKLYDGKEEGKVNVGSIGHVVSDMEKINKGSFEQIVSDIENEKRVTEEEFIKDETAYDPENDLTVDEILGEISTKVEVLDELAVSAKEIFANETIEEEEYIKYFTGGKAKYSLDISGSTMSPKKMTMFGGKFEDKYEQQLIDIIYSKKEKVEPNDLYPFLVLMSRIKNKRYPITIADDGFKKLLPRVVKVLNDVFNDKQHRYILNSINTMFEGMLNEPEV